MKNLIRVGLICVGLIGGTIIAESRPRFEHIYSQDLNLDGAEKDTFNVVHDRDTGQELVCVTTTNRYNGATCYLTGRRW